MDCGLATDNTINKARTAVKHGAGMYSVDCDELTTRATCGPFPEFFQFVVRLYELRNTSLQHSTTVSLIVKPDFPGQQVTDLILQSKYNNSQ